MAMKILAPVNHPKETEAIIKAGAGEIYCGVMPKEWKSVYANVASANRREWQSANLSGFSELEEIVNIAHDNNTPVYLALNALYTLKQYPLLLKQIEQAVKMGIDALIVADLGAILTLKKEKFGVDIHISTGGTAFNSQAAKFYQELGAARVILPRHLAASEIEQIIKDCPDLKFEVFILNSGCKNIDGFCTFQHGVNEILHRQIWNFPKRLNFDRHFLNLIRLLPRGLSKGLKVGIFGVDSACLLSYKITFSRAPADTNRQKRRSILRNIYAYFNLLSAVDSCGACRLAEFKNMGVCAVKIVGRNYSTEKKIKDVKFIKNTLQAIESREFERKTLNSFAREEFIRTYGVNCGQLCYFPQEQ